MSLRFMVETDVVQGVTENWNFTVEKYKSQVIKYPGNQFFYILRLRHIEFHVYFNTSNGL